MRKEYLIGITNDGNVAFADVEVRNRNCENEFTASFDVVRPTNFSEIDLEQYIEDYLYGIGDDCLYNLCNEYDCSPNNLVSEMASCTDIQDYMDCSLYTETIDDKNDNEWGFESDSGGQGDTREYMKDGLFFMDENDYDYINYLWDNFHLKELPKDELKKFNSLISKLDGINNDDTQLEWLTDYINNELAD